MEIWEILRCFYQIKYFNARNLTSVQSEVQKGVKIKLSLLNAFVLENSIAVSVLIANEIFNLIYKIVNLLII